LKNCCQNCYLKNKKSLDATNIKRSLRIRIPSKQVSSLYYNTDMVSRYYGVERWSILWSRKMEYYGVERWSKIVCV
jgi:hypothetical protein